jgi:hypothetical protein
MGVLNYRYEFRKGDAAPIRYDVAIDERLPDWTRLEFQKCKHCPFQQETHPRCPVAANIAEVVESLKDKLSHDKVSVRVEAPERTYVKTVPMQEGIFSILGLIMATSDCPHMRFLKPLARFHLPFATIKEVITRTVSMFLLRCYLEARRDVPPRFDLARLDTAYANVSLVNEGIAARIRAISKGDAGLNAIVILHSLATLLSYDIGDNLAEIQPLFH